MIPRTMICTAILLATLTAVAADKAKPAQPWFDGMLTKIELVPALPKDFIAASLSPDTPKTMDFDMVDGVIWAPPKTAKQYEFGAEKNLTKHTEPLIYVRMSLSVAQLPGTDNFNIEKDLEANMKKSGLKNLKIVKVKWGKYPVLAVSGDRPDGSTFYAAWLGINVGDGTTLMLDYRPPLGEGHPTEAEKKIWDRLLSDTKKPE